ncbi:hypothetical protein AB7C87_06825 [Natrarchaeobius sp. A-rgal3]|uniref:hypothetical protein n=1 Tax=Natrarchaeobius versutus TaxID=1679078 RepID=UPI00350F9CBA
MSTHEARFDGDGFVSFFRGYTKTWIHTVAAAGLTAFGTLTVLNRWFAVLAIATYVVPPIALYLSGPRDAVRRRTDHATDGADAPSRSTSRRSDQTAADADGSRAQTDEPASTADVDGDGDPPTESQEGRWETVDFPTSATLLDVVVTATGDAYAVGEGGAVVTDRGEAWELLLEDGPAAGGNDLRGVDAADDGAAVWIAGDSGALARIDVDSRRHTDYTAPRDVTDNWLGVAVGGAAGDETILLITGSGTVVRGRYRGDDLAWDDPVKPGSGSSLSGVSLVDSSVGHCCDTNDGVFETADGGRSFDRIGLEGADGTLEGVAVSDGGPLVSADDGVVHRYDGSTWTPERVAETALPGIAVGADRVVVCGADGSIHERAIDSTRWERIETAADGLLAVSSGPERSIAVGEDGIVLERTRPPGGDF